jgi:hypothetical protein
VQDNPCLLQAREAGTPLYQPALICPSGPGPTMPLGHVAAVPVDGFSKHMLLHGYSIPNGVIYMRAYSTWRCGCIPVQGSRGPGAGRQTRQPALVPSTWQEKPAGVTDQSLTWRHPRWLGRLARGFTSRHPQGLRSIRQARRTRSQASTKHPRRFSRRMARYCVACRCRCSLR